MKVPHTALWGKKISVFLRLQILTAFNLKKFHSDILFLLFCSERAAICAVTIYKSRSGSAPKSLPIRSNPLIYFSLHYAAVHLTHSVSRA